MRKNLAIIQTGGTIAMQPSADDALGFPNPRPASFIKNELPEIFDIADLTFFDLFFEDSSNMHPEHWDTIVGALERLWPDYDGFVILHGTDTMAYTASALSFAIKNINKPVIVTGSQIPLSNIRSDAKRNMINAVEVATLAIPEVAICFNDAVYRGNRTTKLSIADFNAFGSPNFEPLATIGINISLNESLVLRSSDSKPEFLRGFESGVFVLHLFPGMETGFLASMVPALKGLVIEAYGCGNIPVTGSRSLLPVLQTCADKSIPVVIASQAVYDAVDLTKYESGIKAAKLGVWSAGDMTLESCVVKLMWVLKHIEGFENRENVYHLNLAGERK